MADKIPNLHSRQNSAGTIYFRYRLPNGNYHNLGKNRVAAEVAAKAFNERRAAQAQVGGISSNATGKSMAWAD